MYWPGQAAGRSEQELQPKLNIPRQISLSADPAERSQANVRGRVAELDTIGGVECLGAQLEAVFFPDRCVLEQREVEIFLSGTVKIWHDAGSISKGERGIDREIRRVEVSAEARLHCAR